MWKERLRKIRLFVTIIIIIGAAAYLIFVYDAAKSISIVDKRIEGVYPSGIDEYEAKFSLTLKNPKNFDIEIDYMTYRIYIDNEFVGKGAKPHFFVEKGIKKYGFEATFSIKNLSRAGREVLMNGKGQFFTRLGRAVLSSGECCDALLQKKEAIV